MPKDWRTSIIDKYDIPLYKREDQEVMGNYTGISLCAHVMCGV